MFDAASHGSFKGLYCQGEDIVQSDPNTQHVAAALSAMECIVVQDIFLNETAKYAHVFLPGSSFLEKDGTFTNAERRISRVRKVMPPLAGLRRLGSDDACSSRALGYPMDYTHPSQIMDEIARLTPTFHGVIYEKLDELGSIQWPCNDEAPEGTPTMHIDEFVRGKGTLRHHEVRRDADEKVTRKFPLLLTTGPHPVAVQRRRADAPHRELALARRGPARDSIRTTPRIAASRRATGSASKSRAGQTVLRAKVTERMQPGVVYTTFHFPESGANVITTDSSDWATNCPEYKVTAVQVMPVEQPSQWQKEYSRFNTQQLESARMRTREAAPTRPQGNEDRQWTSTT